MDVSKKCSSCYLETEAHKKPQFGFRHVLADNSYNQFKHFVNAEGDGENVHAHPYKEGIEDLLKNLSTEFVELFDGEVTKIEDTECDWVQTTSQLEDLVQVLSKEKVFGVDTEQHAFRSFLGFTALIQISTTSKDYLVDAIALHDVIGILRPVFANPHICKVFHGAFNDIMWLQRDFHIYVVNLFDTARASEVLCKERASFANLIEIYCGASKNKDLQREDWTPRPLSAEMLQYARTDSHYLLPVANHLVSELKSKSIDLVVETIRRSNMACLRLYGKDTRKSDLGRSAAESVISCLRNQEGSFHYKVCDNKSHCSCLPKFQRIVRRLCAWREIMARVHDENFSFILSDNAIGAIAATLPTTETDIHNTICRADDSMSPSPVVCSHALEDFGTIMSQGNANEDDDFGQTILQGHLGSNGKCPQSSYNHKLLDNIPKLSNEKRSRARVNKNGSHAGGNESLCSITTADGRHLWHCNQIKMALYINQGIAKLVKDDPPTIMLLNEDYKNGICARCGGVGSKRYQIIPECYLQWFPSYAMEECSEIKLVCDECYGAVNKAAMECKWQIVKEVGIIVEQLNPASDVLRALYVAKALLGNGGNMPPSRVEEFTKKVEMYYAGREVTKEDLKQFTSVGLRELKNKRMCSQNIEDDDDVDDASKCWLRHGRLIVGYLLERPGAVRVFWQRWRQVFVKACHQTNH